MKLMGNSVLIQLDPESNKVDSGILYKPDGAMEHVLRTGVVLDVGPGKYLNNDNSLRQPMDVSPGDGVVFVKFVATHTETAKSIQKYVGDDKAILQYSDIMLVYDRADPPVFSQ